MVFFKKIPIPYGLQVTHVMIHRLFNSFKVDLFCVFVLVFSLIEDFNEQVYYFERSVMGGPCIKNTGMPT